MPTLDLPEIVDQWRVKPGSKVDLKQFDPRWAGDKDLPKTDRKKLAESILSQDVSKLAAAQDLLYASNSWSILIVLQGLDAAGKDGLIKHVMSGVNPSGCQVFSFKQPSAEELDHNFLWRYSKCLPERGRIGIFNRSYYEEVLVVRVHPEWIVRQRIPEVDATDRAFWVDRYNDINAFERHLTRNGTLVLKFFVNVSKDQQQKRLLKRLKDPTKQWKFSSADLAERSFWDDYQSAYANMLSATSTKWAPWYVVPADHKWVTRAIAAQVLTRSIEGLKLSYPEISPEQRAAINEAKRQLEAEQS